MDSAYQPNKSNTRNTINFNIYHNLLSWQVVVEVMSHRLITNISFIMRQS